ncbi:hypothetical protein GCM10025874_18160 [Arenivirga flava]|uniref:Uncharacterized protein n=1 Tax=Arenivirga flava TaxID=1930060 RepID=A0AA37UDH4_9MICO|nr:hypothetical protein GCM10025874_18160 [Arenivirga flava]
MSSQASLASPRRALEAEDRGGRRVARPAGAGAVMRSVVTMTPSSRRDLGEWSLDRCGDDDFIDRFIDQEDTMNASGVNVKRRPRSSRETDRMRDHLHEPGA